MGITVVFALTFECQTLFGGAFFVTHVVPYIAAKISLLHLSSSE